MNIPEILITECPEIKEEYSKRMQEEIDFLRQEAKEPIPEHEWWREYIEEEETIQDVPIAAKYSIFYHIIIKLTGNFEKNQEVLIKFFNVLERELASADQETLNEVEVLLLEGIINYYLDYPDLREKIEALFGLKTKKLCELNHRFWGTK